MPNTHTTLTSLFTDIADAIRAKKGTSAQIVADNFPSEITSIQTGITPTGNINITNTNQVDVTNYATAQVVDADLVAENIKKDVNILGVIGSLEGGGAVEPYIEEELQIVGYSARLTKITFHGYISIRDDMCKSCSSLTSAIFNDGLKAIGTNGFEKCTNLSNLILPDTLESIGEWCFYSDKNAFSAHLNLPTNLKSVSAYSFYGCTSLESLTFRSKPKIASTSFNGCTNITTINVPWSEGEVANAPWGATNATINYNYAGV